MRLAAGSTLLGALLLGTALVTGCTQAPGPANPAATTAPTASASPTDTGPPVITMSALPTDSTDDQGSVAGSATGPVPPSASSSAGEAAGFAPCAVPYVRVTVRPTRLRAGHAGYLITFAGTGQIACQLTGYPAVTVLNAKGRQLRQAARTPRGYLGGLRSGAPKPVVIGPGETASALLEGVAGLHGKPCPAEPALLVTPPATRTAARVKARTAICDGVQVHPVVAGQTGSAG